MYFVPSRLKLASEEDVVNRLRNIIKTFDKVWGYSVKFLGKKSLRPDILYTTQQYLESDKMGYVLYSILYRKYYAPIIVIRGYNGLLYIFDGHHRARAYLWLRELVDAYLLEALSYKPRYFSMLKDIEFVNPSERVNEYISVLRHMVNIIRFIEKKHNRIARVWRERIPINKLYVTQPLVKKAVYESKEMPPPLIYRYGDKYFIVDGHTRVCLHLLKGRKTVDSIVFTLNKHIGLIKTAEALGFIKVSKSYCSK